MCRKTVGTIKVVSGKGGLSWTGRPRSCLNRHPVGKIILKGLVRIIHCFKIMAREKSIPVKKTPTTTLRRTKTIRSLTDAFVVNPTPKTDGKIPEHWITPKPKMKKKVSWTPPPAPKLKPRQADLTSIEVMRLEKSDKAFVDKIEDAI